MNFTNININRGPGFGGGPGGMVGGGGFNGYVPAGPGSWCGTPELNGPGHNHGKCGKGKKKKKNRGIIGGLLHGIKKLLFGDIGEGKKCKDKHSHGDHGRGHGGGWSGAPRMAARTVNINYHLGM